MPHFIVPIDRTTIQGAELFPLAIAPMEKFMLWDDSVEFPKRIRVVLDLDGEIDHDRLRLSIQKSIIRHPMLLAVPDKRPNATKWLIPDVPKVCLWAREGDYSRAPAEYLSRIANGCEFDGLCIWSVQNGRRSNLVFDFHHACCDGQGSRQFVSDILYVYDQLSNPGEGRAELPDMNPLLLTKRDRFRKALPTTDSRPTTLWEKLVHAFHFHCLAPSAIPAPKVQTVRNCPTSDRSNHVSRLVYKYHVFEQSETDAIKQKLRSLHQRLNDVACALLIQTIGEEFEQRGAVRPRMRILVPTDLREPGDRALPSCNRVGFGFLVANAKQSRDFETIRRSVVEQLIAIRNLRLGLDFVNIFGAIQRNAWTSILARRLMRFQRCMATAVLSNMGDATRRHRKNLESAELSLVAGNLLLTAISGVPPIRPLTSLGVGLTVACGRFSIASVVDLGSIGEDAIGMHDRYVQAWRNWLDKIQVASDLGQSNDLNKTNEIAIVGEGE